MAMTYLATKMATSISTEQFDASKVEWDPWSRRFNQWLKISTYAEGEHPTDKMQAAFCTFIESDTFKLLYSLCAPKKPEECTCTENEARCSIWSKENGLSRALPLLQFTSRQMVNL